MAIHIITGKPGGGKSYFALLEIIEELVYGTRVVVTNLPLVLGELNAYIQKHYPKVSVDIHERVRLLSEDECRHFYAHREQGRDFTVPSEEDTKKGVRIDYGDIASLPTVMYVIDEAHIMFDARSWMTSGPHLTYYNSQHRKPGDEVLFITQFVALLDKRCTGFAQEFIEVRNYGMERIMLFRGPLGQHEAVYTLSPPGPSVRTCHRKLFRLDLNVAKCYSTVSGVGMSGRKGVPREKGVRGLHWSYAVGLAFAVLCALWYVPDVIAGAINVGVGRVTNAASKVADNSVGRVSSEETSRQQPPSRAGPGASNTHVAQETEHVYLVGWTQLGHNGVVWLSDGSEVAWANVRAIYSDAVVLNSGTVYRRRPASTIRQ